MIIFINALQEILTNLEGKEYQNQGRFQNPVK